MNLAVSANRARSFFSSLPNNPKVSGTPECTKSLWQVEHQRQQANGPKVESPHAQPADWGQLVGLTLTKHKLKKETDIHQRPQDGSAEQ